MKLIQCNVTNTMGYSNTYLSGMKASVHVPFFLPPDPPNTTPSLSPYFLALSWERDNKMRLLDLGLTPTHTKKNSFKNTLSQRSFSILIYTLSILFMRSLLNPSPPLAPCHYHFDLYSLQKRNDIVMPVATNNSLFALTFHCSS